MHFLEIKKNFYFDINLTENCSWGQQGIKNHDIDCVLWKFWSFFRVNIDSSILKIDLKYQHIYDVFYIF